MSVETAAWVGARIFLGPVLVFGLAYGANTATGQTKINDLVRGGAIPALTQILNVLDSAGGKGLLTGSVPVAKAKFIRP